MNEIDTCLTEYPICPYCGLEDSGWMDINSIDGKTRCEGCDKIYSWCSETTIFFSTQKVDWLEEWIKYNTDQIRLSELRKRQE